MANVVNNMVKMEWDTKGFLVTSKGAFVVASKVYENANGDEITVFFNCSTAFLWASDKDTDNEDLWAATDLLPWVKKNLDGSFPIMYDEYVPVVEFGAEAVNAGVLEKYGLADFEADIMARLRDLAPYAEETDKPMGK